MHKKIQFIVEFIYVVFKQYLFVYLIHINIYIYKSIYNAEKSRRA